jgi:transposase
MGRSPLPTKGIVDSQSVKNTDCALKINKGYDGGKKVGGIKRNIITDTNGIPIFIHITPANESERSSCHSMLIQDENELIKNLDTIYADGGYLGERFEFEIYQDTGIIMEIVPRNKQQEEKNKQLTGDSFQPLPKRWIIERSFAWIEKCRRLWKNTERLTKTSKIMVQLCFIRLLAKRLGSIS